MIEAAKTVVSEPIAAVAKAVEPVAETVKSAAREPVAVAARTAVSATEAVSKTTTAAMDKAAAVTEAAVTPVVRAAAATKPTLTQGIKTMMKSTEDFVAFGQANMEAFVKSSQIWSAGVQELSKQIATSAKASYEESVSTFKAISTAKSVKEAMDLQSTFAKAALEKAMAESNKLTDASIKLTEQTLAPITARVTLAVETFGKAA
jgi:phasin family protein